MPAAFRKTNQQKQGGIMKTGKIAILLLLGGLFVLSGCKGKIIGKEIPADRRIQLVKNSPQTGRWEAFEYALNYKYLYTQLKENAIGSIEFSASLEKSAGRLDSLSIWVYLLDATGRVIEIKKIYDSGYKEKDMDQSFSLKFAAPPESASISFAHTAMASRGHR
jgi:hypothetical protein